MINQFVPEPKPGGENDKKILIIALVLIFAAPALARRTDMMSSYGFSKKYKKNSTQQKYNRHRYIYRKHDTGDMYLHWQDRYRGDRYRSKAGRMLYENEHYNNYVDRNRYLKERRKLDLEKRRRDIEKSRK